ncbi:MULTISPECIES: helix-turn-helix transcriptional regulator [Micromonospora]|uniref:XRE family transcriptional regulator n=1 Tax=Micromonospora solifontis TaxID=2487138 RepID=A0ABX9WJY4_9ACTN|nr:MULTISPECIES: helix-turn-helix transcriptional regulator [Micromonospora]NES13507.1 helix-turn-helix transcriptional regulator [Micromonospora sp. PPF5-17B]NES35631.1 helix-turn-helix transcriptional regulator [Micromonospora solifontis]NES55477.1 helix-turn-helix transcriptional regulator [Micromonospora sp. PPF5-6]RNM00515.1 XRE family transcriptional regulator [Micromonospora solifontis]
MDAGDGPGARPWAEFGRELRVWRRRAGLTQGQLGLRVGYHYSVISKLESGLREPPMGLPRRLDALLGSDGTLTALAEPSGRGRPPRGPSDPTLFPVLPAVDGTEALAAPGVPVWPPLLPYAGFACPLHDVAGCPVPGPHDLLPALARLVRGGPAALPDRAVPDLVHGLTALLPGYTRASVEQVSTEVVSSIERVLHLLVGWAEVVDRAGRSPLALLRLAAQYAQLAARLRMQRGQSVVGMAWVAHGLAWAGAGADTVARATLLSDFCTLTRLDRDAASSLAYARALGEVDRQRGWMATLSHLYQARAYGLAGAADECLRQVLLGRRRLDRLDARDVAEAPWLTGDAGVVRAESSIGGALRDLAAATGDRATARRAVHATSRSLSHLPARMRPTYLLLTVRLADAYACAGEPDAAVAVVAPVAAAAARSGRATITHELRGLRARLAHHWSDLPEVRDLHDRLRPTPQSG